MESASTRGPFGVSIQKLSLNKETMSLQSVPGQERAKRFLGQLIRTGHIPHALLFSGMAGVGKATVARQFIKSLNCLDLQQGECCDGCISCRKIDSDLHPDLLWVANDGAYIKIDQVRDLRKRIRFRPFEGTWRGVVIQDAQKLRDEAANALLKILEEPPKHNIFILLVLEPQMLLPTIVSRCCHVRFQPLEDNWIEQHLIDVHRVSRDRATDIARLAEGSLERARWLVEGNHFLHWQEILSNIQQLHKLTMIEFFGLMARWSQKSEDLEQDLECIKLWIRDITLSRLINNYRPSLAAEIPKQFRETSVQRLFGLYDQIEQAVQNLQRNANKQLTLEAVCLAIKDISYGQSSGNSFSQRR